MKTKLLAASLLLLLAMAAHARANDWKKFTSEKGTFSVLLPGTPEESVQRNPKIGNENHSFFVRIDHKSLGVAYSDFADEEVTASKIDALLDNARDDGAETTNGTVREEKKIDLDGHPGREVLIDTPRGYTYRVRFYLVKNRLYDVVALAKKGKENDADVVKFFDSFQPIDKVADRP